ncbi:MAG: T9SS type A sorting domain-containing protein [Bacteroidales bacterium]|nr:T9SS type A sorting domain-containing protein [Bacteroidales bacterium]
MKSGTVTKKFLVLLFNAIVLLGFAAPADTIPPMMPPRPPQNYQLAPHIHLNRSEQMTLTNLVIFIRFADDEEFTETLEPIDQMFNDTTPNHVSVHNYYNAMTYGKINYHTVYTNNIQDTAIISYQDPYPRSYFQPQSETNPDGYTDQVIREFEMLARVLRYVDSLNLVDSNINLDGNNDGLIDNISFILKGGVGDWNDLLWPHMNFFSAYYAGLPEEIYINGKLPRCYNFEFANSGYYFSANVFCHEMGHSLGIPDYYHYYNYNEIVPVGIWDQMAQNNLQQISTILKYKFLGIVDEPIEITSDGHYILNSNTSSDHNNCYFIRSSIDPDQWFTIEYRNSNDFMENVPRSGVIIGRWYDNVNLNDLYDAGNGVFDFYEKPHTYWVFRPGSTIDTINGNINFATFGNGNRRAFGPTTNPRPFLTDGTPETSFEITNIQYSGDHASFDVTFLHDAVPTHEKTERHIYPNPAQNQLNITFDDIQNIEIYDLLGNIMFSESNPDSRINISSLPQGVYVVKIITDNECHTEKFIKK